METPLINQTKRVLIHVDSKKSSLARRAEEFFPSNIIDYVLEDPAGNSNMSPEEYSESKSILYIKEHKGAFFKTCPGAKGMACCNYFVLNLGLQCNMNCSYCYLQSYLNTPTIVLFSNIDDALLELQRLSREFGHLPYRVGTGETTDSLSFDDLTLYSKKLIAFFRTIPEWSLEFKTKSKKVDQFLDEDHAGNVIVSWSINPSQIVNSEEHETATLEERFEAANKVLAKGYKAAFHMDPIIWHPEWEKNYFALVDEIAKNFTPEQLPSITLGALRFQPHQRHIMRQRFGMKSWVNRAEMFPTKEGKWRYDQDLRNIMFQKIKERFQSWNSNWNVWLCMETTESWIKSFDQIPGKIPKLKEFYRPLQGPEKREVHPRTQTHPQV